MLRCVTVTVCNSDIVLQFVTVSVLQFVTVCNSDSVLQFVTVSVLQFVTVTVC